jgi:hypothetical protein
VTPKTRNSTGGTQSTSGQSQSAAVAARISGP